MAISPRSAEWLAGLLEGEGCFSVRVRMGKGGFWILPRISLAMTDEDVVRRAHAMLAPKTKITIRPPAGRSKLTAFTVQASGRRAAAWMMTLYPLMGKRRRAKIRAILSVWIAHTHPRRKK